MINFLSIDLDYFGNRGFKNLIDFPHIDSFFEFIFNNDDKIRVELEHHEFINAFNKEIKESNDFTIYNYDFHDDVAEVELKLENNNWLNYLKNATSSFKKLRWRYPSAEYCINQGEGLCQLAVQERKNKNTDNILEIVNDMFKDIDYDGDEAKEFFLDFEPNYIFICISQNYVLNSVLNKIVSLYRDKFLSYDISEISKEVKKHPNLKRLYQLCTLVLNFRRSFHCTSKISGQWGLFTQGTKAQNINNIPLKRYNTNNQKLFFIEYLDYSDIDRGFINCASIELNGDTNFDSVLYNWIIDTFVLDNAFYVNRFAFRLVRAHDNLIYSSFNANLMNRYENEYGKEQEAKTDVKSIVFF